MTVPRPGEEVPGPESSSQPLPSSGGDGPIAACGGAHGSPWVPQPAAQSELIVVTNAEFDNGLRCVQVSITPHGLEDTNWPDTVALVRAEERLAGQVVVIVTTGGSTLHEERREELRRALAYDNGQSICAGLYIQVGHRTSNGCHQVELVDTGLPELGTTHSF